MKKYISTVKDWGWILFVFRTWFQYGKGIVDIKDLKLANEHYTFWQRTTLALSKLEIS